MADVLTRLKAALSDRYAIESELGSGGMATVYLAQDLKHHRNVAVKVLRPELAAALGAERFLREIEITAGLEHPHILTLLDSGEADGFLYYVMPFIEGESLRDRLDREKQLPLEDALQIARNVAAALGYAHSHDVVHRDIKPENILLSGGEAVVADFGIARAITAAGGERLTETGLAIGTPAYMSPEQGAGSKHIDGQSDTYSLGCVLYEMLAGHPPFTGSTAQEVLARHSMDAVPSLHAARPAITDAVDLAITKALAKTPADRFATASEFADALSGLEHVGLERRRVLRRPRAAALGLGILVLMSGLWLARQLIFQDEERMASTQASLDPRRIAVLYFDDHSEGQRFAHLADGLTEGLIHELSQVEVLEVISRNGVRPYRNTGVTLDSVVRALAVGSLVEGSIMRSGDRLRVTVQLVDAATLAHLDSRTLERPWGELFALQDDLVREVSRFLREQLGEEIRVRETRAGTGSVAAWELVQQATQLTENASSLFEPDRDFGGMIRVLEAADSLLAKAESADPAWLEPTVQRGWIAQHKAFMLGVQGGPDEPGFGNWMRQGIVYAERALSGKPEDPAALELRGTARRWLGHFEFEATERVSLFDLAEADLRAAVAGDPARARAWNTLSELLQARQKFADANLAAHRALKEDPFLAEADQILQRLFWTSLELGHDTKARDWCEEARRQFPTQPWNVECALVIQAMSRGFSSWWRARTNSTDLTTRRSKSW